MAALLAVVATGIIYTVPSGQSMEGDAYLRTVKDMSQAKDGDSTVLATVNGLDFTEFDARMGYELLMADNPGMTKNEAIRNSIVARLDEVLLLAEGQSREIAPADESVQAAIQRDKAKCETDADQREPCTDIIEKLGYENYDEYWEQATSNYRQNMTRGAVIGALQAENEVTSTGQDDDPYRDLRLLETLRSDATIVWNNTDMQELYKQGLADRAALLESTP